MNTIIKNLFSVLRRFKMATILNILGLSVAFAAFMLIIMQLGYDYNYNKMHDNSDRIFRVEAQMFGTTQGVINRPLADAFIASSPHIVAGSLVNPWGSGIFFTVENNGVRNNYRERSLQVYPEYTDVFKFSMVEGSEKALGEPNKVLMPLSMARKIFGNESAIGKELIGHFMTQSVGGVYHDFPSNSSVGNVIYYAIHKDENLTQWGNWNYHVYIRVDEPENAALLMDNFRRTFDTSSLPEEFSMEQSGLNFRLTSLPDVHYVTDVLYDAVPKASKQTLLILLAIAIVIVLIAGINFTNFSTALTPMRIKSINTQKVLGSEENVIRLSLVMEALIISALSYLIALVLISVFNLTPLAALLDADTSLAAQPMIVAGTGLIALLTGLLAGLYPAFYMTSFPPALVLKGSFGLSPKGRKLRNILIGIQFIASFALIIGSTFMYLQNRFMQNSPLGYEKDQVIITDINSTINKSLEAFSNQLKTFSGIEGVAFAQPLLSSGDQYMGWGRKYRDTDIEFQCLVVDPSFLQVMGIEILEGRDFREEDTKTRRGAYIFNEKARDTYNLETGTMVDSGMIVGIIPDVKFASFRTEVTPMAFYVWGTQNWGSQKNYAYVRVKAGSDMRAAVDHVRTTLGTFDAEYPFNIRFFDEVLNRLYEKEQSLSALITLFSLIAIFISIVGVFGLVVFDSEYRKKEIGLRKVLGSTTNEILILFNKSYVKILVVCFVLAVPMAGYAIYEWLKNFAYKTPMYWWVYLIAFVVIFVITILTVTFQNWRSANENPVNSIKNE